MTERRVVTAREAQPEHGVVVVFDVVADDDRKAAQEVVHVLVECGQVVFGSSGRAPGQVVSWWLAEGKHKEFDGNDNDDMTLVARDHLESLITFYEQGDSEGLSHIIDKLRNSVTLT